MKSTSSTRQCVLHLFVLTLVGCQVTHGFVLSSSSRTTRTTTTTSLWRPSSLSSPSPFDASPSHPQPPQFTLRATSSSNDDENNDNSDNPPESKDTTTPSMEEIPHPPDSPPPPTVLQQQAVLPEVEDVFFLQPPSPSTTNIDDNDNPQQQDEQAADWLESSFASYEGGLLEDAELRFVKKRSDNDEATSSSSKTKMTPTTLSMDPKMVQQATSLVAPLFSAQVQPNVPQQAIQGALWVGAAAAALAGKGVAVTGAASLGAAYLAITTGPLGEVMRTVGGLAYEVGTGATFLVQEARTSAVQRAQRLSTDRREDAARNRILKAQQSERRQRALLQAQLQLQWKDRQRLYQQKMAEAELLLAEKAQLEGEALELQQRLQEVARLKEEARLALMEREQEAAEHARMVAQIQKAEEERLAKEAKLAEEAKQARLAEEARQEQLQQEARLAKEAEQARVAAEQAQLAEEAEQARLAQEAEMAQLAKEAEEAQLAAEAELARLAEEEEEARQKELQEEERLAQQQQQQREEEEEEEAADEDEQDWQASIRAAQQSIDGKVAGIDQALIEDEEEEVEMEDDEYVNDDEKREWTQASQKAQTLGTDTEDEMEDEEMDPEDLAAAARAAVEAYESQSGKVEPEDLAAAARVAVEAYESQSGKVEPMPVVQEDDMEEIVYDEEVEDDDEEMDPETLAAAARAAVEAYESSDEDEEEVLVVDNGQEVFDGEINDEGTFYGAYKGKAEDGENTETTKEGEAGGTWVDDSGFEYEYVWEEVDEDGVEESAFGFEKDKETLQQFMDMNGETESDMGPPEPTTPPPSLADWSSFTVAQLRKELKNRGLPTQGKKVELVSLLQQMESESPTEDASTFDEARAMEAVESYLSNGDEPTDEELRRIEESVDVEEMVDFESLTIPQLKDELRARGLRLSGKKADLVSRLQSFEDAEDIKYS